MQMPEVSLLTVMRLLLPLPAPCRACKLPKKEELALISLPYLVHFPMERSGEEVALTHPFSAEAGPAGGLLSDNLAAPAAMLGCLRVNSG